MLNLNPTLSLPFRIVRVLFRILWPQKPSTWPEENERRCNITRRAFADIIDKANAADASSFTLINEGEFSHVTLLINGEVSPLEGYKIPISEGVEMERAAYFLIGSGRPYKEYMKQYGRIRSPSPWLPGNVDSIELTFHQPADRSNWLRNVEVEIHRF